MRNDVGNILGLVESDHYEAIPAETVEKLYELFGLLEQLFENRGKEGLRSCWPSYQQSSITTTTTCSSMQHR